MTGDKTYLEHILDAIDKVSAYTVDGRDAFMVDTKTQDAVVRNFEIIRPVGSSDIAAYHDRSAEYGRTMGSRTAGGAAVRARLRTAHS